MAVNGTVTVMLVFVTDVGIAATPLNVTVVEPLKKLAPVIVTVVPGEPCGGVKLVAIGDGLTVNAKLLLAPAATVTITGPLVAPTGTTAVIDEALQAIVTAASPLKVTTPDESKLAPAITID